MWVEHTIMIMSVGLRCVRPRSELYFYYIYFGKQTNLQRKFQAPVVGFPACYYQPKSDRSGHFLGFKLRFLWCEIILPMCRLI